MVNYQNGKIYKLWSDQSKCFYIGSTTQSLAKRLGEHKKDLKKLTCKTYEKMQGHTNIKIELIEAFPCNTRKELTAREGYYIRLRREQLLNKCIAGRTVQECLAEWRAIHKVEIAAQKAEWYAAHKDEIAAKSAAYRAANKGKISAYRAAHKDEINAKKRATYAAKKAQN